LSKLNGGEATAPNSSFLDWDYSVKPDWRKFERRNLLFKILT
jgi:hypothetical protein